jgi:hypothetical protein
MGFDCLENIIKICGTDTMQTVSLTAMDDLATTQSADHVSNPHSDARPLILMDDPIALSCAAYRKAVDTDMAVRFTDLNSVKATDQDHELAETIRKYYANRIMFRTLSNSAPVTKFYRDLYELVVRFSRVQHRHLGMIYRLPYFYVEDLAREELEKHFSNTSVLNCQLTVDKETQVLVPVSKIFRSRKSNEIQEYWFRNELGQAVLWAVNHNNALRSIIESLWTRPSITVEALFNVGQVRTQSFYHYYLSSVGFPAE